MRIGIFADTHDHVDNVRASVDVFNARECELVVFAGDFVSPIVVPPLRKLNCPLLASFGDNEGNKPGVQAGMRIVGPVGYPPFGFETGDGTRILVTHILSHTKDCLGEAEIVIFAHTHRASLQQDESGRLFINPGEGYHLLVQNNILLKTIFCQYSSNSSIIIMIYSVQHIRFLLLSPSLPLSMKAPIRSELISSTSGRC